MTITIDLVILSRHAGELHPDVEAGIRDQRGVQFVLHRAIGAPMPGDSARCDAIARARNQGKLCGTSPWLMFLDDDVVLGPNCVPTLVEELEQRPSYAALGADYLAERRFGRMARHVSMGATLFRRDALDLLEFGWRGESCECQCCCDDLRRMNWRIDYSGSAQAFHLSRNATQSHLTVANSGTETITCLCISRGRVEFLRNAVQCFLTQTYRERELAIVHDPEDSATCNYLATIKEPTILPIPVPGFALLPLGALRNISVGAGSGKYIAVWDDDDWSHPARLQEQMRVIRATGKPGCALERLTLFDCPMNRAYVSGKRYWENTLLVERSVIPPYPHVAMGEDSAVVNQLVHDHRLALVDAPELYVYMFHGQNTWNRAHWERLIRSGRPLGFDASQNVSLVVGEAPPGGLQFAAADTGRMDQAAAASFAAGCDWRRHAAARGVLTAGALRRTHARTTLKSID